MSRAMKRVNFYVKTLNNIRDLYIVYKMEKIEMKWATYKREQLSGLSSGVKIYAESPRQLSPPTIPGRRQPSHMVHLGSTIPSRGTSN